MQQSLQATYSSHYSTIRLRQSLYFCKEGYISFCLFQVTQIADEIQEGHFISSSMFPSVRKDTII